MQKSSILAAAAAMIGLSASVMMPAMPAPPFNTGDFLYRRQRERMRGKPRPAGAKLAHKAYSGTVGKAKLR